MGQVAAMSSADVTTTVIADYRMTAGSVIWAAATIGPDMTTVIVGRSRLTARSALSTADVATIVLAVLGGKMTGGEQ